MTEAAVRPAAVAGSFYPSSATELAELVDEFLDGAGPPETESRPVALVAPHAGYRYSGPVAATAYNQLRPHADEISRVVLLGPAHFVPLRGLAVPAAVGMATPLATVPVDVTTCLQLAAGSSDVTIADGPHEMEHSLEVHLPFLQRVLRHEFVVVPLAVGRVKPAAVADLLDLLVPADDQTVVIVSSDLSHHLDHDTARRRDLATAAAVTSLDVDSIGADSACGVYPLRGLVEWSARHDFVVSALDLRSSGDTAGGRHRVVGYGAFRVDRP